MPLRISSSTHPDSMAISLEQFEAGRQNFRDHYFVESKPHFIGQNFSVPWTLMQTKVQDFINQYQLNPADVAMTFVHCYDPGTDSLFMRLKLCTMQLTPITDNGRAVYAILPNPEVWYDVKANSITNSTVFDLTDNMYMQSFVYKTSPEAAVAEPLSAGYSKFVQSITFPWQNEVLQMYTDNGSPANALLHFGSCSYTEQQPGDSDVLWPHGLVMYLSGANGPMLDNNSSVVVFSYKGADLGTMCPPKCNTYIPPANPIQNPL